MILTLTRVVLVCVVVGAPSSAISQNQNTSPESLVRNSAKFGDFAEFVIEQNALSSKHSRLNEMIETILRDSDKEAAEIARAGRAAVDELDAFVPVMRRVQSIDKALNIGAVKHNSREVNINLYGEEVTDALDDPAYTDSNLRRELRAEFEKLRKSSAKELKAYIDAEKKLKQLDAKLFSQHRQRAFVEVDYLTNLYLNEPIHRPAIAREVRLESRFGDVYHAYWEDGDDIEHLERLAEMAQDTINDLMDVRRDLERKIGETREQLKNAEAEWAELNAQSHDEVVRQLVAEGLLEAGDVTVSAATSGPGWPATVIFEGVWRGGHLGVWAATGTGPWGGYENRKVKASVLSDDLVQARITAASRTNPGVVPPEAARPDWKTVLSSSGWAFASALKDDAKKEGIARLFDIAKDRAAHGAMKSAMNEIGVWGIINTLAYDMNYPRTEKAVIEWFSGPVGGKTKNIAFIRNLLREGAPDLWENVASGLEDITPKDLAKTGAVSAAVNAGKVATMTALDIQRHSTERRMAEMDIKYFGIRNSLDSLFYERLSVDNGIREAMVQSAEIYSKMASDCCLRDLKRTEGTDSVVAQLEKDYDDEEPLTLIVTFEKPVEQPRYSLGSPPEMVPFDEVSELATGEMVAKATVTLRRLSEADTAGTVPLAITAGSEADRYPTFDGDPETLAMLDGAQIETDLLGWKRVDQRTDHAHKFPEISVDSGIYLSVIDFFGSEGLRVLPAPNLPITVFSQDGEVVAEEMTPEVVGGVFIKLPAGSYRVTLNTDGYFPVPATSCNTVYERQFTLDNKQKLAFGAKVKLAEVADNGTTLGSEPGECIFQMKSP